MKTIRIDAFDKKSVEKAISDLKAVKKEWKRKANLCSEMIAAVLADEIQKNLEAIYMTDDLKDVYTDPAFPQFRAGVDLGQRVLLPQDRHDLLHLPQLLIRDRGRAEKHQKGERSETRPYGAAVFHYPKKKHPGGGNLPGCSQRLVLC